MYGGYRRRRSFLKRLVRRFRRKKCDHSWEVYGVTTDDTTLLVRCETCGARGTVPDPSEEEWNAAFALNGEQMDWPDGSSVVRGKARKV